MKTRRVSSLCSLARIAFYCRLALAFAVAFLAPSAVVIRAAEPDESAQRLTTCEMYPLGVGTQWTYRSGPIVLFERVAKHEKIGNETCARVETMLDERIVNYEHLAVRADGVYRVSVAGRPVNPPLRLLKLPAKAGDDWTVESKIGGQTIRGQFKTREEPLVLRDSRPEGDRPLTVFVVSGEDFRVAESPISTSYAARFGKVKQTIVTDGQTTVMELLEFAAPGEPRARSASRSSDYYR
jgi:hypothetical protein